MSEDVGRTPYRSVPPLPTGPRTYSPDEAWDYRAKVQGRGTPGEQIVHNYGPEYGNASVMATADRKGRFNSFGDVPRSIAQGTGKDGLPVMVGYGGGSAAATPRMSPLQQRMALLQQRIAYHRGRGDNISASGAERRLEKLQEQEIALGTLGVHQGQLGDTQRRTHLLEQTANPDITGKWMGLNALAKGDPAMAAMFARSMAGGSPWDLTRVRDMMGAESIARTADIYNAGGVGTQLGVPGVQALPPIQPFRLSREDEERRR